MKNEMTFEGYRWDEMDDSKKLESIEYAKSILSCDESFYSYSLRTFAIHWLICYNNIIENVEWNCKGFLGYKK